MLRVLDGRRASRLRSPRALQRQPEVAPGRGPRRSSSIPPAPSPWRRSSSTCSSWPRSSAWPRVLPRGDPAPSVAGRGPLCRLRPALRHPLQPEQRRELRGGAGPRDLGSLPRGALVEAPRLGRRTLALAAGVAPRASPSGATSSPSSPWRRSASSSCDGLRAPPCASFPALAAGWALGNAPGLLWNLAHRGSRSATSCRADRGWAARTAGPGFVARLVRSPDRSPARPLRVRHGLRAVGDDGALALLGRPGRRASFAIAVFRASRAAAWRERDPALARPRSSSSPSTWSWPSLALP